MERAIVHDVYHQREGGGGNVGSGAQLLGAGGLGNGQKVQGLVAPALCPHKSAKRSQRGDWLETISWHFVEAFNYLTPRLGFYMMPRLKMI